MSILEKVADLLTRRKMEQLEAEIVDVKAKTDYVAMMTDIEIPTEEGGEDNVV